MARYRKGFNDINAHVNRTNNPEELFDLTMNNLLDGFYDYALDSSNEGKFKAICLSGFKFESNAGDGPDQEQFMPAGGTEAGQFMTIIVRPLQSFADSIPDPKNAKDPNQLIRFIAAHKVFTAVCDQAGSGEEATKIPAFGQIVDCYYEYGSVSKSNYGFLKWSPQDIETNPIPAYRALQSMEGTKAAADAFAKGAVAVLGNSHDWSGDPNNIIYKGSVYPDDPIQNNKKVNLNKQIIEEYLPALEIAMAGEPKGLKLLATAQAIKEGFVAKNYGEDYRGKMYEPSTGKTGTRSYRFNNPGNIGNTDSGDNVTYPTLVDGIKAQAKYLKRVASGKSPAYPLGKTKKIEPYFSEEIAKNQKSYKGKSPYLPGYEFVYTGQLDQFVKIYATAARSSNNYMSMIISYFNNNGITITNTSKIQDIIAMN